MAGLPHAIRITMLLCEFNGSDNYLCSSYFQPKDLVDLTDNSALFDLIISEDENVHYHVGIVNRLCIDFRFGSLKENQFRYLIFIIGLRLLPLFNWKFDVKKFRRRPESAEGLLIANVQLERIRNRPIDTKTCVLC
ncbi:unnamed protein product [Hymenolepis diminuta]|uniref:Uncharacterized protein n=1 Tax=Hymenolepis diminuta TaxID=6216 RepID=A0A564YTM5_HYMDI|nr:unnamed protein product [Hymenolepis diminuta]